MLADALISLLPNFKDVTKITEYANTRFDGQVKRVYASFFREPQTMLMVERKTSIMRANICRYVAVWKKLGVIHLVRKAKCPISNMVAGYYSTDPAYRPSAQLTMFQK